MRSPKFENLIRRVTLICNRWNLEVSGAGGRPISMSSSFTNQPPGQQGGRGGGSSTTIGGTTPGGPLGNISPESAVSASTLIPNEQHHQTVNNHWKNQPNAILARKAAKKGCQLKTYYLNFFIDWGKSILIFLQKCLPLVSLCFPTRKRIHVIQKIQSLLKIHYF